MTNLLGIGVDAGRNEVKAAIYDNNEFKTFSFGSRYVDIDFDYLKNVAILDFDTENHIIASVDDKNIRAYGKFCNKFPPDQVQFVTADDIYLEHSVKFTLIAVAKFINSNTTNNIVLGLNLTANNINKKEEIQQKCNGAHNVKFYNNMGKCINEVNFTIEKTGIWFQGWTAYLNYAFNDDFSINLDYVENDALMIDMGRRTLEVVYINELSNSKVLAFDLGMERLYKHIQDTLYRKYDIRKTTVDIDNIMMNGKEIKSKTGEEIPIKNIIKESMVKLGTEIRNSVIDSFSEYTPHRIIFTGGGTFWFKTIIEKMFPGVEIMKDPVFSNALGLTKLIVRKFIKNKKGTSNESQPQPVISETSIFGEQ